LSDFPCLGKTILAFGSNSVKGLGRASLRGELTRRGGRVSDRKEQIDLVAVAVELDASAAT
jgi:hypothetical protein